MEQVPFNVLGWQALEKPGLQQPGRPEVLRDVQYGGGDDDTDRRMILHTAQLRELLAVAESSVTGRVVLHRVGLRVQLLQANGGHRYEHCTIVATKLEPEAAPFGIGGGR